MSCSEECYHQCYLATEIRWRCLVNTPRANKRMSVIRRVFETYSQEVLGIIIRVSGVRVPPPLLVFGTCWETQRK